MIKNICVIGAGYMGRQIALNFAIYGFDTMLFARRTAACEEVENWKEEYLDGRIKKGRLTKEQVEETKSKFHITNDLEKAVEGRDCIIECIAEVEESKCDLFRKLDIMVDSNVIIATNSSFMPSSKFADCVSNPARLANMHFYNPALVLEFVEIVKGPHTSEETAQALMDFCKKTGKTPILMMKEIPGFAANYILMGLFERAWHLVENGYCSYQDVDIACEKGLNHPMGPFRLTDLTGIDITLDILKKNYEETGVKPDGYDLHEQMVKEGRLGRKTGRGFYDYK